MDAKNYHRLFKVLLPLFFSSGSSRLHTIAVSMLGFLLEREKIKGGGVKTSIRNIVITTFFLCEGEHSGLWNRKHAALSVGNFTSEVHRRCKGSSWKQWFVETLHHRNCKFKLIGLNKFKAQNPPKLLHRFFNISFNETWKCYHCSIVLSLFSIEAFVFSV